MVSVRIAGAADKTRIGWISTQPAPTEDQLITEHVHRALKQHRAAHGNTPR